MVKFLKNNRKYTCISKKGMVALQSPNERISKISYS